MKQSKRQARDRNREARKQSRNVEGRTAAFCSSCGAQVQPDARFCHRCGGPLAGGPAGRNWHSPTVILYAIIGLALTVAVAGVIMMSGGNAPVAPRPSPSSASPANAGQPPDLSRMSPREAADRLFNRVVMASEQGNTEEALRFAPMALDAYASVDPLDADAHYHMGLIYSVMGDYANVREQVSVIKQYAPDHLLGLILEHDAAEAEGNPFAAARAAEAFAAAYDSEIMSGRPEYDAHRKTIETFRTEKTDR